MSLWYNWVARHELIAWLVQLSGQLIKLDVWQDNCSTTSLLKEEAVQVLLRSVACEETSSMQLLSASILSTIGGTFSWTGEPYTVAWLLKKVGLSSDHQNMIKSFDWLDQSLQVSIKNSIMFDIVLFDLTTTLNKLVGCWHGFMVQFDGQKHHLYWGACLSCFRKGIKERYKEGF